jgi:hypothetical protein
MSLKPCALVLLNVSQQPETRICCGCKPHVFVTYIKHLVLISHHLSLTTTFRKIPPSSDCKIVNMHTKSFQLHYSVCSAPLHQKYCIYELQWTWLQCLHLRKNVFLDSLILNIKALPSFNMSETTRSKTLHHIPQDLNLEALFRWDSIMTNRL